MKNEKKGLHHLTCCLVKGLQTVAEIVQSAALEREARNWAKDDGPVLVFVIKSVNQSYALFEKYT